MTRKEKAVRLFEEGYLCSQAVPAAFAELCGISQSQAIRMGACLGTGMRQGEVCGAVTGALLILGLLYGDERAGREHRKSADLVNDCMMNEFRKRCGSLRCNELLQCDVTTKEGLAYAREHRRFTEFCPQMVACAVEVLEQIIAQTETPEKRSLQL